MFEEWSARGNKATTDPLAGRKCKKHRGLSGSEWINRELISSLPEKVIQTLCVSLCLSFSPPVSLFYLLSLLIVWVLCIHGTVMFMWCSVPLCFSFLIVLQLCTFCLTSLSLAHQCSDLFPRPALSFFIPADSLPSCPFPYIILSVHSQNFSRDIRLDISLLLTRIQLRQVHVNVSTCCFWRGFWWSLTSYFLPDIQTKPPG